jgi:hypothetical protein
MIRHLTTCIACLYVLNIFPAHAADGGDKPDKGQDGQVTISSAVLRDKIRGGWAGQTIGVTFGGPYEFRFNGTFIQEYQPLLWYKGYVKEIMTNIPGLYDDIYMDLTFVDVFQRLGFDAPVDSFASAFAHAGYKLWHANQAARYNILNGIHPPQSGHWTNNPHADDIDFQIESDFSGLMSPGMPNTAAAVGDHIGHIMNYGDGWYGGVFVGAMYSLAFFSNDVHHIVQEALKMIPEKSEFHQCIADVLKWRQQYPDDWHQTWFNLQKKWSSEIGCPDGVYKAFDIDAKINAAYVVMGLLYGNGDFGKSLEIATRAGQDADCNPSTVGGILGTVLGYEKIPAYWKDGLDGAEDIDFKYTSMSLNKVYEISYQHALEMIRRNGGAVKGDRITIAVQQPRPVRFEKSFEGKYLTGQGTLTGDLRGETSFSFRGSGFVLMGDAVKTKREGPDRELTADLYIDGKKIETSRFPTDFTSRRLELFWNYQLPEGEHTVRIVPKDPPEDAVLRATDFLIYSNKPAVPAINR